MLLHMRYKFLYSQLICASWINRNWHDSSLWQNSIQSLMCGGAYMWMRILDIPTFLKHQCHLLAHCVGQRAQAF